MEAISGHINSSMNGQGQEGRGRDTSDRLRQKSYDARGRGRGGSFRQHPKRKVLISNLDYGITDWDIRDLFSRCGPIKRSAVHYDRTGRSLGTADVTFRSKRDAIKSLKLYNGKKLDGRAMVVQIATSEMPKKKSFRKRKYQINRPEEESTSCPTASSERAESSRQRSPTDEELIAELDAEIMDST